MSGGWVCADPDCAKKSNGWSFPTSSLVHSNFKFTKDKKPICVKCWKAFKYNYNNGTRQDAPMAPQERKSNSIA